MNPFSQVLHDLRMRHNVCQSDLAEQIGYEQSYISALEVGLKGPPTEKFLESLIQALSVTPSEQFQLRAAAQASQRKLIINQDAPPDVYWLLKELREVVNGLSPGQVRMIREVLGLREVAPETRQEPVRRLKRRRKAEAKM